MNTAKRGTVPVAGMRQGMLILALLFCTAHLAWAQLQEQLDTCYSPTASDDATIESCTAVINTGQYSGTTLSGLYNNRATGYEGNHQYDLAIQDENQAVRLDPTNAEAFSNRCDSYVNTSLYDSAIADCDQALTLKPDYPHAYDHRAAAYEGKGLRDQAIRDYQAASRLDPNDAYAAAGLKRLGAAQ